MRVEVRLRKPEPGEAAVLSAIAWRSKAHWGYDDAFMRACRDELTVSAESLKDSSEYWQLAEVDGRIAGFIGVVPESTDTAEIEALFVEPEFIGGGIGRHLLLAATDAAKARGYTVLVIQSDPDAAGFYEKMGAKLVGDRPSDSVPGRRLPLYELDLTKAYEQTEA